MACLDLSLTDYPRPAWSAKETSAWHSFDHHYGVLVYIWPTKESCFRVTGIFKKFCGYYVGDLLLITASVHIAFSLFLIAFYWIGIVLRSLCRTCTLPQMPPGSVHACMLKAIKLLSTYGSSMN